MIMTQVVDFEAERKIYIEKIRAKEEEIERIRAEKDVEIERIRKTMAQQAIDLKVTEKALMRDLQNRCERVTELEISLEETREQYNDVLRNSDNKALQKKVAFLERNLTQLTNVQKQLVEQNSSQKKEIANAERKLLARNERIQALEALLQDAQEKAITQNQKFEAQLQAVRERLEQARSQKLDSSSSIGNFGRIAKPLRSGIVHEPKQENEKSEKATKVPEKIPEREQQNQQFQSISQLLFPNQPYNFNQLQQEIIRLKIQELAPQVRDKITELERLITDAKTKAGNLEKIVDLLLETQKKIDEGKQNKDQLAQTHLEGQLTAYQNILEGSLTKQGLQTILTIQTELCQSERHLENLKQEQVAQTQQVNLPNSSQGDNH